jgi:hypothetical protein
MRRKVVAAATNAANERLRSRGDWLFLLSYLAGLAWFCYSTSRILATLLVVLLTRMIGLSGDLPSVICWFFFDTPFDGAIIVIDLAHPWNGVSAREKWFSHGHGSHV